MVASIFFGHTQAHIGDLSSLRPPHPGGVLHSVIHAQDTRESSRGSFFDPASKGSHSLCSSDRGFSDLAGFKAIPPTCQENLLTLSFACLGFGSSLGLGDGSRMLRCRLWQWGHT